jgi:ABC-type transport system involved in multi-copper enzyme maturation permease subunit
MFTKIWAIAGTTFTEIVRQPIFNVLTWAAFGLLLLNPGLAAFSLMSGKDVKILIDVGLSTLLLYGLLISVFSAAGVITREIESFTVLTVISKPVGRPTFLLGKYLGVATAALVGFTFLSLVLVNTVHHGVMETASDKYHMPVMICGGAALGIGLTVAFFCNYVYGWHFGATLLAIVLPLGVLATGVALGFDAQWKPVSLQPPLSDLQLLYALLLVLLAVLVLASFAVAFSTRFSQVISLMLCAGVFLLGLLSDYYFGLHVEQGWIYRLMYEITPNFQFFWVGDALTQELPVPLSQVALVAGYAAVYITAVLGVAVAMFQTREVG